MCGQHASRINRITRARALALVQRGADAKGQLIIIKPQAGSSTQLWTAVGSRHHRVHHSAVQIEKAAALQTKSRGTRGHWSQRPPRIVLARLLLLLNAITVAVAAAAATAAAAAAAVHAAVAVFAIAKSIIEIPHLTTARVSTTATKERHGSTNVALHTKHQTK